VTSRLHTEITSHKVCMTTLHNIDTSSDRCSTDTARGPLPQSFKNIKTFQEIWPPRMYFKKSTTHGPSHCTQHSRNDAALSLKYVDQSANQKRFAKLKLYQISTDKIISNPCFPIHHYISLKHQNMT
jgi:hypothetical protein